MNVGSRRAAWLTLFPFPLDFADASSRNDSTSDVLASCLDLCEDRCLLSEVDPVLSSLSVAYPPAAPDDEVVVAFNV